MKTDYRLFRSFTFSTLLLLATITTAANALAPETSLGVACDGAPLLPGVPCVLSFRADDLPDLHYAGLELRYDTSRMAFVQVRAGSVFGEDAVVFARQLPNGRLGLSVSSTAGEREGTGGLVHLDFVVRDGAPHGEAQFAVEFLEVTDRDGAGLPAPLPEPANITIPPYLTDAGITDPGPVTIARGSELTFRFRLAASGITADDFVGGAADGTDGSGNTGDDGNDGDGSGPSDGANRLTAEMVIVDAGAWDGSAPLPDPLPFDRIIPLAYTGESGGQFRFEAPFPVEQAVGSWRVVARFRLDDHPVLNAGYSSEGGGIWDGETNTAVEVTVTTPRVTVAEWTFNGEQWIADTGLFLNLQAGNQAEVSLAGARFSGWTTGSSGRAPNSNNWQQENDGDNESGGDGNDGNGDDGSGTDNGSTDGGGDDNGNGSENGDGEQGNVLPAMHDKYWQARLATTGYSKLTLQFRMSGSGTGPRDFRLYYAVALGDGGDGASSADPGAIDGDNSNGSAGGADTSGGSGEWQPVSGGEFQSSTSWSLTTVTLPADAADAGELLLRWVRIGNTSISGNDIGPTGTNRIDDIRITGVPLNTDEMFVWPGSTSGAGTVTEADVLNLGFYWMSTGPERVPRNIVWAPQPVVFWTPASAAHADTDGDGRVDYRDLLAIGRNFGETVGTEPVQQKIAGGSIDGQQGDGQQGDGQEYGSAGSSEGQSGVPALLLEKGLPLLEAGESVRLVLRSGDPVSLTGLSTRFSLDQIPPGDWELAAFHPAGWADDWEISGRLIRFHYGRSYTSHSYSGNAGAPSMEWSSEPVQMAGSASGNTWSAAWVHTGSVQPARTEELAVLVVRAISDWQTAPQLRLHRASLSTPEGVRDADASRWTLIRQELPVDAGRYDRGDLPQVTHLYTGYPNPFNPVTTLSFDLHESGTARLAVYDALGRQVATLVDGHREAGRHQVSWNASQYASGMYIVRLETAHATLSRRIMLVK